MNTWPTRVLCQHRLGVIAETLRPLTKKGVLYGSQVHSPSLDRDIDVVVIIENGNEEVIFRSVARLQMMFSQIVHVVVVSERDLERNPSWLKLIEKGVVLWKGRASGRDSLLSA